MEYAALVLGLIKIILDLVIFLLKKIHKSRWQKGSTDNSPCLSLIKGSEGDICSNPIFKRKMKNGNCPREKCHGFVTEAYIKEEKTIVLLSSPIFLTIKQIIDIFPELATAILALSLISK